MNKKGLFGILNDGAGAGAGVDKVNPDTTLGSAVDCTMATPVFIDDGGVLVFPQLNADGSIPVDIGGAGTCKHGYNKVTGSTSFQDLGEIPSVAVSMTYSNITFQGSSATEACYEVVYIDDAAGTPTETILACFNTGPGQYSFCCNLGCIEVDTTGGTGTQRILLRAKLLEATGSEICGTIAAKES